MGTEIWFRTDKKCGRTDGRNGQTDRRTHGRRQNYIPLTSSGDNRRVGCSSLFYVQYSKQNRRVAVIHCSICNTLNRIDELAEVHCSMCNRRVGCNSLFYVQYYRQSRRVGPSSLFYV